MKRIFNILPLAALMVVGCGGSGGDTINNPGSIKDPTTDRAGAGYTDPRTDRSVSASGVSGEITPVGISGQSASGASTDNMGSR